MSLQSDSQSTIKTFNVGLIFAMLVVFGLGVLTLYSATKGPGIQHIYRTQIIWFFVGCLLVSPLVFVDSQVLQKVAYPLYGMCLVLLIATLAIGQVGGGAQRWLRLGFLPAIQPSEFAKVAIVFALARYFSEERKGAPYTLRRLLTPGLLVTPLFILILLQPDIGTAGILFLAAASIIFFLKVDWRSIAIVCLSVLIVVPLAYKFVLRDYQRQRVITFLDPGKDPRGSGYNALQCRIAVGGGKVIGKGFLKGTQAQLNFIPEQHTDFIFSVYAEERGFVGGVLLLLLYGTYLFFAFRSVGRARDKFEMLLATGCAAILFWHVFINIGMVIGVLPIVGVTLPFFSYGGSSLITFLIVTALLLNVGRKKYIF
ncbi:MAG: rod shape-determining protein RodA [Deltaproteobacteria bacterium]|nr:rod shape-determining protein RodA [Deltaproteobacteria bacterium]MBI3296342.1 rod shape-determining protein RodA [Deltaproteobacteria bacterium]